MMFFNIPYRVLYVRIWCAYRCMLKLILDWSKGRRAYRCMRTLIRDYAIISVQVYAIMPSRTMWANKLSVFYKLTLIVTQG